MPRKTRKKARVVRSRKRNTGQRKMTVTMADLASMCDCDVADLGRPKRRRRSVGNLGRVRSGCKIVRNSRTGVRMRGCYDSKGRFRFTGKA